MSNQEVELLRAKRELVRAESIVRSNELQLARLRSHEIHMRHIYSLRWGGLALSALTIAIGAVMVFKGLTGSFNWAVEAPDSLSAKLTNASPGIVFATIGLMLGFVVVLQKPVSYSTGGGRSGRHRATDDEGESILANLGDE